MSGCTKTTLAMAMMAGAVGCASGERYRNLVDPCSMERYGAEARQELITCFTPQVQNGRILDQTLWNDDFEPGTDKLVPSGYDKLDQIVRRRPEPDPRVFIQTARDLPYDAAKPDAFAQDRRELDARRGAAIEKYLAAQTSGRPMQFTLVVHDPAEPVMAAQSVERAIRSQHGAYTGILTGGGAGGAVGPAGGPQAAPPPQAAQPGGPQQSVNVEGSAPGQGTQTAPPAAAPPT